MAVRRNARIASKRANGFANNINGTDEASSAHLHPSSDCMGMAWVEDKGRGAAADFLCLRRYHAPLTLNWFLDAKACPVG